MRKISVLLIVALVVIGVLGTGGIALADSPQTIEDGFVCPVLGGQAGEMGNHNGLTYVNNGTDPDGPFYTVSGPDVSVPQQATNGSNGTNSPPGYYESPGEANYTAIWP